VVTGQVLLHVALGAPLAGCLALAAVPRRVGDRWGLAVGVVASGIALVALLLAAVLLDTDDGGTVQFATDAAWAPAVDLRWHLGVDGLSLPFALLTALLVFCCCLYTVRVRPEAGRLRAFIALVLLLEVGMLGTFLALDLLLFFLFFEVVLVPMWFLIAWWGDPHDRPGRTSAATTFILYTLLGSAIMLVGFLLVHAHTGTFDMVELAARGGEGLVERRPAARRSRHRRRAGGQGAGLAAAHLAARRAREGAHRRIRAARRSPAEDGLVRAGPGCRPDRPGGRLPNSAGAGRTCRRWHRLRRARVPGPA
jgi:formate hydrogenlyase subunit 3/multisubunit Na+/H+ antiporter MnhD subunit